MALHSHATGQIFRCFAMKTNFMSLPSQRRLRPFLKYPAPPSVCCSHAADAQSPAAPASFDPGQGQMKPEQQEIERLRRENNRLRAERDILKKAAAFFAKEAT